MGKMNEPNEPRSTMRRRRGSIFFPLVLIAIGVIYLLSMSNVISTNAYDAFLKYWPIILIVIGLDGFYRGDSYVGAVVMLGAGIIFLLGNLGSLQLASWETILRLWPVLFLIWGFDLLLGQRKLWSSLLGAFVGLLMVGGIYWFVAIAPFQVQVPTQALTQELQGVSKASVDIEDVTGTLNLQGGAQSSNLVQGNIQSVRTDQWEKTYSISGQTGNFVLKSQQGDVVQIIWPTHFTDVVWSLDLNDTIPLDLTSKMVVGKQELNLSTLMINTLLVETTTGQTVVTLPDQQGLNGEITASIGDILIYVPANASIQIETDTGLTAINYPTGYTKEGNIILSPEAQNGTPKTHLTVNLPIGSLRIRETANQ
jgi:hypothetical protein